MKILIIFAILSTLAFAEVKIEENFLEAKPWRELFGDKEYAEGRIVGGHPIEHDVAPFFALLHPQDTNRNTFLTGGTLVRHDWILTSAAIVSHPMVEITVFLGIVTRPANIGNTANNAQWHGRAPSSSFYPHPLYNPQNFDNNIGLLRIPLTSSDLQSLNFVSAVALPRPQDVSNDLVEFVGSAFGFGRTETQTISTNLRSVSLTVITNAQCAATLPQFVTPNVFCTANPGATSVCAGDEGGPFTGELGGATRVLGVVSFSVGGCAQGVPATFVRVANYLGWIHETFNAPPRESGSDSIKINMILAIGALLVKFNM